MKFLIKSFKGGLSDYENKGTEGSFKFGKNLNIRKKIDSLSCNQALKNETPPATGFHGLILFIVNASDGNSYGFDNAGYIYKRTVGGIWTQVYDDSAHGAIKGAEEWFDKNGKAYLYWATDTRENRKELPGLSNWTDVNTSTDFFFVTTFSGIGVDDLTQGGTYVGTAAHVYDIQITTIGTPDKFKWRKDGGAWSAEILITGGAQTITDGLTVTFISTAGHALNDIWTITVSASTWPKTNLTSADWHTHKVAVGVLNIANKDKLAFVGYDNSYTNESLTLIPGNLVKALVERGNLVIVGTGRIDDSEAGSLFAWNTISDNWDSKKLIPAKGVNALIDTEFPLAQVGINGGLFLSDMQNVMPIKSFPNGGRVNPDGVENDQGLALFGVFGNGAGYTGIYSFGRKGKNNPVVLNLEYQFDCDEIGSVKKIGSDLIFSYKVGATYGVKIVDTANKAQAVYDSIDLVPNTTFQQIPNFSSLVLTTKALPAGCKIEVWYKLNKQGNFIQARMQDDALQFVTTNATEAVFLLGENANIFETEVILIPNGNDTPEIYTIEPYLQ